MKKSLVLVLMMILCCALVFAGCGDKESDTTYLTMGTGSTSGTYYAYGAALGTMLNNVEGLGVNVTVNSSGASAENVRNIAAGEIDLAIMQNDVLDYATYATNTWTADPITNARVIATLYPEIVQLVVATDSGITSVEDLKGKTVSIGDVGSGVETNAIQILGAYGITLEDINVAHLGFSQSADAMKDRTIDAFFVTAAVPNTAVMDLSTSRDLTVLPLDADVVAQLLNDYPFYAEVTLTDADYSFLAAPVTTVAVKATLVCPAEADETLIYNLTKAIFDNKAAISHDKVSYLSAESAVEGVSVEFHPGAAKYYKELNLM